MSAPLDETLTPNQGRIPSVDIRHLSVRIPAPATVGGSTVAAMRTVAGFMRTQTFPSPYAQVKSMR
ncbi:hypothetical protein [Corynebacterium parakroppenstedtii]|uniref:hypothetical protein n=1 Tax=Corynebacterium parakroppenstedtii TaxID=2828363 RepID=UPI0030EC8858